PRRLTYESIDIDGRLAALLLVACGGDIDDPTAESFETRTDALAQDRSFAVTHEQFLKPFTLERVLKQIVALSGVPGITHLDLFRQMWDTQNPSPGIMRGGGPGPFCDTILTSA